MRSQMSDCFALDLMIEIQLCHTDAPVRVIDAGTVACKLILMASTAMMDEAVEDIEESYAAGGMLDRV